MDMSEFKASIYTVHLQLGSSFLILLASLMLWGCGAQPSIVAAETTGGQDFVSIDTAALLPASSASVATLPATLCANGLAQTTLTLKWADVRGGPLTGQNVSLAVSGSNNSLSACSGVTNGAGAFVTSLTSTTPEVKTITASLAPLSRPVGSVTFQPLFTAPWTSTSTGVNPRSIAVGDFNGDTKPDPAVTNFGTGGPINILLGTGNRTFAPKVDYVAGNNTIVVATGDFNGDTKLDLVAANFNSSSVNVLLGSGTGTFGAKTDFTTGTNPHCVVVSNFDADNIANLAVVNTGSNTLSMLTGSGTGSFAGKVDYSTGGSPIALAIDDFMLTTGQPWPSPTTTAPM